MDDYQLLDDPTHDQVLDWFAHRCPHCYRFTTVVHELCPRSQCPRTWWHWVNRIPICNELHELVHQEGTRKWADKLREWQRIGLEILCTAEEVAQFYSQVGMRTPGGEFVT